MDETSTQKSDLIYSFNRYLLSTMGSKFYSEENRQNSQPLQSLYSSVHQDARTSGTIILYQAIFQVLVLLCFMK